MKRKILSIFLSFSLMMVLIPQTYFAQTETPSISMQVTPTPSIALTVEYQLPYPGLLPDNAFYYLKTLRDKIVGFLISDPIKKAEFDLLAADKRLNAASFLFEKGKYDLALSTISKGENYFEEAIEKTSVAKKEGRETTNILIKLSASVKKHKEVLTSLGKKAPGNSKAGIISSMKRLDGFENQVNLLISR